MKKLFIGFISLFLFSSCTNFRETPFLLQAPKKTFEIRKRNGDHIEREGERIKTNKGELDKEFTISWTENDSLAINVNFTLKYFALLPDGLQEREKNMFKEGVKDGVKQYVYHYGPQCKYDKQVSKKEKTVKILNRIAVGSLERNFKELSKTPHYIRLNQLATFIAKKRVLFVTGAGVSMAAKIPSLQKLYNNLGIIKEKPIDQFTKDLLSNPKKLVNVVKSFQKSLYDAKPTLAHHALTKLAFLKSAQIITDNYDGLHEKAGIEPYKLQSYESLSQELTPEVAKKIDGIICIGSSMDFKAVLGRYKALNPLGIIVAINKSKPQYLGYNDFLLKGDIQKLVPLLADAVKKVVKPGKD